MSGATPIVEYSKSADALYVRFRDGEAARTESLDDRRMIDWAADGATLGIEFLDVSGGIDLDRIPERAAVQDALRDSNLPVNV